MPDLTQASGWLPLAFMLMMGLAILAYVILDGYDLGVGILLRRAPDAEKDMMIASIGPFWDANETWLVLGVGILLVAFPLAHNAILGALYLPVALMLVGLILRGVAFDFRVKAHAHHKQWWNLGFYLGSLLATLAQGYMLGMLVVGFRFGAWQFVFSALIAISLAAGYALLGAGWLLMKTSGGLQAKAMRWARASLWLTALGIGAVSLATPLVSAVIFQKWFSVPNIFLLAPIPIVTAALFVAAELALRRLPARLARGSEQGVWVPFACAVGIFLLSFHGLAYSLFPYLVIERLTIWQAASATDSLMVTFIGAVIVLPTIIGYTIYSYRVFWGKAAPISYH